ncbi:MAG: DEAD/DEAH box helicase [Spirochaetota bacterium]|jgi:superfamily II DNA/RNA helicase
MEAFISLGIDIRLTKALDAFGFVAPSEVQKRAIPVLAKGQDLIMQSETGTGKTFAYLLPIFSRILGSAARLSGLDWPSALIICPTQELAVQVARQAALLAQSASVPIKSLALLGGTHFSHQKEDLKAHPHIITGTPGRLADLVRMRFFDISCIEFLVLDEADRLFSKEYIEPVEYLLSKTPASCVRALASATIPEKTRKKAYPWMHNPIAVDLSGEGILTDAIEHWVFYAEHRKKIDLLKRIIAAVRPQRCLIFASDTYRVQRATERLQASGLKCHSILSRMEKQSRHSAIDQFQQGIIPFLVTTDLGARGLDIPDISHVISLDLPEDSNAYVHRAGRTGRAGKKGISILVADGLELERASRAAVKYGFVFRTKWLESGQVIEPEVEEFFERVQTMEDERSRRLKS